MSGFDLKQVSRNDKGLIGAGIVAFIASLLPFVGISGSVLGVHYDAHINAWHGYAILGLFLIFIAAGIAAARVFAGASLPKLPVGPNVLVAGLALLGTLLVFLYGITYGNGTSIQWGGWILIIVGVIETVFAVMNFRSSGEKLAWDATAMNKPATAAGGASVPPAQASSPTDQPTASSSDQV
jgi:hypothetical protein